MQAPRSQQPAPQSGQPTPPVADRELSPGVLLNPRAWTADAQRVLVPQVTGLLAKLHRQLEPQRQALLAARREWQARMDSGALPDYLDRLSPAVTGSWQVAPIPQDLLTRRVEITGPAHSAKMVINMLSRNAEGVRADTAMLDLEDAMHPWWGNVMAAVLNVKAAAEGTLTHAERGSQDLPGKLYRLDPQDRAVIIVRPRGLHLAEANFTVDGAPVSAALLDTVLTAWHAAPALVERGHTPAYYIPKTEHHGEAAWWSSLFAALEEALGLRRGTFKATFLIETLPAAYEMEEILHAAREHAVGLNVGRWDKIFSDIKTLRNHPDRVLADRAQITMTQPWMASYALRCVAISHARGAMGIGGMAAFTPGRTPEIRAAQTAKVVEDKRLENARGHDGCWVSHPYFIGPALAQFPRANQLDRQAPAGDRFPDLLPRASGTQTLAGLRTNLRVGIGYLNGWNQHIACVAWDNLMEDLATLEISRAQTWQWLRYGVRLEEGQRVTAQLVRAVFQEELEQICAEVAADPDLSPAQRQAQEQGFVRAAQDAQDIFTRDELSEFLTLTSERV
ncbi:MAG TPA: malate synthase A [bacterium]|nr:malate synthase A [bacterium]